MATERAEQACVIYRNDQGQTQVVTLDPSRQVTLGRSLEVDVDLFWDAKVSRVHALLECIGGAWMVSDDGLSSNGTFLNDERVRGRRRLANGDTLRVGQTLFEFHDPGGENDDVTVKTGTKVAVTLTATQRQVLIALCRPYAAAGQFTVPATNQVIADELGLGVLAVKAHLTVLFEKFEITHVPQNQKRARLAELAFQRGTITKRDLT